MFGRPWRGGALIAGLLLLGGPAAGGEATDPKSPSEGRAPRAPCADTDPLRRPFFGDLHVHTVFSLDASTMDTRNRPADAYRFARGEAIGIQPYASDGTPLRTVQLARPLDFAGVTDHAELLGETHICNTPDLPGYDSLVCRVYRAWPRVAFFFMNYQASRAQRHGFCGEDGRRCIEAAKTPWQEIVEAAEMAYDRSPECRFTTFIGYEWTGAAGAGNNFHRNVIFANDVVPDVPISFIDEPDLTRFWPKLGEQCKKAGPECDVLVIPHNSNLSDGEMFRTKRSDGSPIERSEAEDRQRYEMLVELVQHKGESECMTGLGTSDELCGFEKLEESNFVARYMPLLAREPVPRQFVRNILKEGLLEEERLGINPFTFGLIGSTDTHLGTPGLVTETAGFPGHGGAGKPPGDTLPDGFPDYVDFNPGGLAVLWAEENTRSALFAAMKRREAYATSGPRLVVRFFGGWSYPHDLCGEPDWPRVGYANGVAMGGTLPERPPESVGPPRFAVAAFADAAGDRSTPLPLQRVQIIKGWTEDGTTHEQVYDVAGAPDNGASVDLETCEPSGNGFDTLCRVWTDPDFDPDERAFYYARVLENPTCRWSQQLCAAAGVRCDSQAQIPDGFEDCCSENHQPVIQERAWTSPIWYRPPPR